MSPVPCLSPLIYHIASHILPQVLDNGVTSNEFWRILDCEDGLDWCVFYYSGAASRAGLSYSGAILASKSGDWPASQVCFWGAGGGGLKLCACINAWEVCQTFRLLHRCSLPHSLQEMRQRIERSLEGASI